MRKVVLAALAGGAVLTAFVTPAQAADPVGRKCGFNSATDVGSEAGWQTAVVNGGPLAVDSNGTLVCTIVVNANTHAAAEASTSKVSASANAGVAVITPTNLRYRATAADDVALCTKWVPASGATLYWVSQTPPSLGYWSTDANSACGVALSIEPNYPTCPLWLTIDKYLGTPIAEIWQDCEPYGPII